MVFNFIAPLSEVTGLPPIVFICALVIILFLIVFGILILIKVRSIIRVLNRVNNSLDNILLGVGKQSGESAGQKTQADRLRSGVNTDGDSADNNGSRHQPRKIKPISPTKKSLADLVTDGNKKSETETNRNALQKKRPEEHASHREIGPNIHELLKKSGKPTPYHDLTDKLSKVYPGYDYDYFIKEVEALQKEGKVQVQLVAGKLYFQAKKP